MLFSSSALHGLLLLPAGVLSAIVGKPMVAGRAYLSITNGTGLATSAKTTTEVTTTKPDLSLITSTSSWDGNGTVPPAYCPSAPSSGWCRVFVGTVQLNFWPTGSATLNRTYPATTVLSKYDYTMSSPLVYFVINTMWAQDYCGNLFGTTISNFITSYSITDVTTLQPLAHTTGEARIGPPEQLNLSDLKLDCPPVDITNRTYDQIGHGFVNGKADPACNPDLEWPLGLKLAAGTLWEGCGRHNGGKLGLFDPPAPVSACIANDPACLYAGAAATTSTLAQSNTALPDQAASTTTTAAPLPIITNLTPSSTGLPAQPVSSSIASTLQSETVASPSELPAASNPALSSNSVPGESTPSSPASPQAQASTPEQKAVNTNPVAIATLAGSQVISATAGASYVVVGSQTVTLGGAAITVAGQVVQLQSSAGLVVQNSADGSFTTYAVPTAEASPVNAAKSLAIYEGQTISGVAIASSVAIVGGQTLTVAGSVVTLSGSQVASLGSSGLVVEAPGGKITTIPVPSPTSLSANGNLEMTKEVGSGPSSAPNSPVSTDSTLVLGSASVDETKVVSLWSSTSTSSSPPASTSIGALIMANFSAGDRSRKLGGVRVAWLGSSVAAVLYLL